MNYVYMVIWKSHCSCFYLFSVCEINNCLNLLMLGFPRNKWKCHGYVFKRAYVKQILHKFIPSFLEKANFHQREIFVPLKHEKDNFCINSSNTATGSFCICVFINKCCCQFSWSSLDWVMTYYLNYPWQHDKSFSSQTTYHLACRCWSQLQ